MAARCTGEVWRASPGLTCLGEQLTRLGVTADAASCIASTSRVCVQACVSTSVQRPASAASTSQAPPHPSSCLLGSRQAASGPLQAQLQHSNSLGSTVSSWGAVRGIKSKVTVEYHPMQEAVGDDYATEPTNYVQLVGALRAAPSMDRLEHLVDTYSNHLDAVHVAAALTRLPKLARFKEEDLAESALALTPGTDARKLQGGLPPAVALPRPGSKPAKSYLRRAESLTSRLVDMLLQQWPPRESKGKGKGKEKEKEKQGEAGEGEVWKAMDASSEFSGPRASRLTPRQVANLVWSLGVLTSFGAELNWKAMGRALEASLGTMAGSKWRSAEKQLKPMDVSQLTKGLAQTGYPLEGRNAGLLARLSEWTVKNAHKFSARDVQTSLHAFVVQGHTEPLLVDALCARAVQVHKEFSPSGVASVLRSIACATPTSSLHKYLAADETQPRAAAVRVLTADLAPQLVLVRSHNLEQLSLALGRLGGAWDQGGSDPVPLPAWLRAVTDMMCDKTVRDLAQMRDLEVSAVLHMVGKLRLQPQQLMAAVVDGVLSEARVKPGLQATAAASFLTALAPLVSPAAAAGEGSDELRVRAAAAADRVKGVYKVKGGADKLTPGGVAALCGALVATGDKDQELLAALVSRTETLISQHWASQAEVSVAFKGQQLLEVVKAFRELDAPDLDRVMVPIGTYLERGLLAKAEGEERADVAARTPVPVAVQLLSEVFAAGAPNIGAARAVAQHFMESSSVFLGLEGMTSTASGLVPSDRAQRAATDSLCTPAQLGSLVQICNKEGILDDSKVLGAACGQLAAQLANKDARVDASGVAAAAQALAEVASGAKVGADKPAVGAAGCDLTAPQQDALAAALKVVAQAAPNLAPDALAAARRARDLLAGVVGKGKDVPKWGPALVSLSQAVDAAS